MKVQKVRIPDSNKITWFVLDNDFIPVDPIKSYLKYLDNLERSPNTIHAYANHLKLYWEYLASANLDWQKVTLEQLADFIIWLRRPDPKVVSMQAQKSKRTESTINFVMTVVCCFYDFHERVGNVDDIEAYAYQFQPNRKYKAFLHHINKGKETRVKLLKLKEPRKLPKIGATRTNSRSNCKG
jgi:integrase/recombinase XerD